MIDKHCVFELQWRTRYACRICHPETDYTQIVGECGADGTQHVTRFSKGDCRSPDGGDTHVSVTLRLCTSPVRVSYFSLHPTGSLNQNTYYFVA